MPKHYPEATCPADWLDYDWWSGKWEFNSDALIRESTGGFIQWQAYWLVPV